MATIRRVQRKSFSSNFNEDNSAIENAINAKAMSDSSALRDAKKHIDDILKSWERVENVAEKFRKVEADIESIEKKRADYQNLNRDLSEDELKDLESQKKALESLKSQYSEYCRLKEESASYSEQIAKVEKESREISAKKIADARSVRDLEMERYKMAQKSAESKSREYEYIRKSKKDEAERLKIEKKHYENLGDEKKVLEIKEKIAKAEEDAKKAREKELRSKQATENIRLKTMSASEKQDYLLNKNKNHDEQMDLLNATLSEYEGMLATYEKQKENYIKELKSIEQNNDISDAERDAKIAEIKKSISDLDDKIDETDSNIEATTSEKQTALEDFIATGGQVAVGPDGKPSKDGKSKLDIAQLFGGDSGSGLKGALSAVVGAGKGNMNGATGMLKGFASGSSEVLSKGISAAISKAPGWVGTIIKILKGVGKLLDGISASMKEGLETAIRNQNTYFGPINARLDGLGKNFELELATDGNYYDAMVQHLDSMGDAAYLDKSKMIQNISSLVGQGIAFNVEERALITTLGDRLVTTFEANNKDLLRLIRIQQQDLTAAQLGSEADLNRFFNENFADTSYLTNEYDNVLSNISEAMSIMNSDEAVAFNYEVQKWLGSMYSMGASSDAISKLAQGINALATGNVDYFNGNSAATVLFAGASGGSFGSLLNEGVTAETIDSLMQNIIGYLSQIADDTTLVTKQKRAGVYGDLNLSDVRAILGISDKIDTIAKDSKRIVDVATGEAEADYQLSQITAGKRIAQSEMIDNLINNLKYDVGNDILASANEKGGLINAYTKYRLIQEFGSNLGAIGELAEGTYDVRHFALPAIQKFILGEKEMNSEGVSGVYVGQGMGWTGGENYNEVTPSYIDQLEDALDAGRMSYNFLNTASNRITNRGTTLSFYDGSGISSSSFVDMSGIATNIGGASSMIYSGNNSSVGVSSVGGNISNFSTLENNLSEYGGTTSTSSASISSVTETREATDIYNKLFEDQSTPIRVKLASLESEALNELRVSTLIDIYNKLVSGVEVTDSNNDVSRNVVNALANIRYIER